MLMAGTSLCSTSLIMNRFYQHHDSDKQPYGVMHTEHFYNIHYCYLQENKITI